MEMSRQRLRPSPGRGQPDRVPALRRPRPHAQRRIAGAVHHPRRRGARDEGQHRPGAGAGAGGNRQLPAQREARRAARDRARHDAPIVIVADEQLHTPHYEVTACENELRRGNPKPATSAAPRASSRRSPDQASLNVPAAPAVKNVKSRTGPAARACPNRCRPRRPRPPRAPAFVAPLHRFRRLVEVDAQVAPAPARRAPVKRATATTAE